jgi:hypothetical protein
VRFGGNSGNTQDLVVRATATGLIRAYPGSGVCPAFTVPAPPVVPSADDDLALAEAMAAAYRLAVTGVYGRKSYAFRRKPVSESKWFKTLHTSARMLRVEGISPVTWAAWSFGVWREWKGKSTPPPVNWTFSPTRVDQRCSEYWRECGNGAPRTFLTPAHRELLVRYNRLTAHIRANGLSSIDEGKTRHLSDAQYDDLVRRAAYERADLQARLAKALAEGKWIWG